MTNGDEPTEAQREAAALWLAKRAGGSLSSDDEAALEAWLAAERGNRLAFDQMRVLLARLEAPAHRIARMQPETRPARAAPKVRAGFVVGLAASAAALFGVVWFFNPALLQNLQADIVSGPATVSSYDLPDGSVVRLGANSALDLDFDAGRRNVALLRGEAYFEVRSGLKVPFTVAASGDRVEVVGTHFNVNRLDALTEVTVAEGKVRVTGGGDRAGIMLEGGQQVAVTDGKAGSVAPANLDLALAWMKGRVTVFGQRVDRLLNILERHGGGRILVQPSAAGRTVSGTFPTTDVPASIDTLAEAAGLGVIRVPGLTIVY